MSISPKHDDSLRYDLKTIASWITPGARVLDLGCGNGELLHYLKTQCEVSATGIEISETCVAKCIHKGLTVLQGDINDEILDYPDNAFDFVILSRTLQQIYDPAGLIRSILRIGTKGIASFPNFSHWKVRLQLLLKGHAPISRQFPHEWHCTPNIRVITIKDFQAYAKAMGFQILKEVAINTGNRGLSGNIIRTLPNLRATYGIFLIGAGKKE